MDTATVLSWFQSKQIPADAEVGESKNGPWVPATRFEELGHRNSKVRPKRTDFVSFQIWSIIGLAIITCTMLVFLVVVTVRVSSILQNQEDQVIPKISGIGTNTATLQNQVIPKISEIGTGIATIGTDIAVLKTLAVRKEVSVPKWGYKVVYLSSDWNRIGSDAFKPAMVTPSESDLNQLGSDGWELVASYLEMETAFPNFGNESYVTGLQPNVRPQRLVLIFKRPILENAN